jgi:hypothetical protein
MAMQWHELVGIWKYPSEREPTGMGWMAFLANGWTYSPVHDSPMSERPLPSWFRLVLEGEGVVRVLPKGQTEGWVVSYELEGDILTITSGSGTSHHCARARDDEAPQWFRKGIVTGMEDECRMALALPQGPGGYEGVLGKEMGVGDRCSDGEMLQWADLTGTWKYPFRCDPSGYGWFALLHDGRYFQAVYVAELGEHVPMRRRVIIESPMFLDIKGPKGDGTCVHGCVFVGETLLITHRTGANICTRVPPAEIPAWFLHELECNLASWPT